MKLISHRGNLYGPNSCEENNPKWIEQVIKMGYDVEIDLWYDDGFFLGHDAPKYKINKDWLEYNSKWIWVHCKNEEALLEVSRLCNINYFWHQEDRYALTSKSYIWVYPGEKLLKYSVCVLPELGINGKINNCSAICTDYVKDKKWNLHLE